MAVVLGAHYHAVVSPSSEPDETVQQEAAATERRATRRRWRRRALEVVVVLGVFLAIRAWQSRGAAEGPAPELAGASIAGAPLELSRAPGEPVLVHFWATWCGVCRAEEGTIDGLAEDHRVITVASQSGPPEDLASYLRERELDFPVLADPRGAIAQQWGVSAFPTSFVIGPDGTIHDVEIGYTTSLGLRLRMWWAGL